MLNNRIEVLKVLIDDFKKLDLNDKTQLLEIIVNSGKGYTINSSGTFINFKTLHDDTISIMNNYINSVKSRKITLEKQEKTLEKTKNEIKNDDNDYKDPFNDNPIFNKEQEVTEIHPHYAFKRTFESWDKNEKLPDFLKNTSENSFNKKKVNKNENKIVYSEIHSQIIKTYQSQN